MGTPMDPKNPTPISESQDDGDDTVSVDNTVTSEETEATSRSSIVNPQYYSVMDDEGLDEVFILPPSLLSRLDPEGGSTCEAATDPCVTLESPDATEVNPVCLDWHHGEKQLMTVHALVKEQMDNALPTFEEDVSRNRSSSKELVQNCNNTIKEQRQEFEESHFGIKEDQMVNEELSKSSVDINLLEESESKDICQNFERHDPTLQDLETVTEDNQKMDALKERPDILQGECIDSSLANTGYDWVRRTSEENSDEGLSDEQEAETFQDGSNRIASEILHGENLLQRLQLVQQRQDVPECQLTPQQMMKESLVKEIPEMTQEIQEHTNHDSDISDGWDSHYLQEKSADQATVSQHSEQELDTPEGQSPQQTGKKASLTKQCDLDKGFGEVETIVKVEEEKTVVDETNFSDNEDDQQSKEEQTLQTLSEQKPEAVMSEQGETRKSMASATTNENEIPFSPCHRSSTAETFMEKRFQEAYQRKQDLQRTEGVFDLTDNPDVLEIPFKTNISLEPLPAREGSGERGEWQFSEQKMQKEISQEMQRELVMVNQGKIPGGYSKGESRQMKDTKLLFEAFQQDKMEGPTRLSKPQSLLLKSQVYPSVLERTRSLEMFLHKASPIIRTFSFRLLSSTTSKQEKYPESIRSQSPSGSSREKAHLNPYPKHEKPLRLHKSMESISTNSPTSVDKTRKTKEAPLREGSPLLKENPFFKLRPALALQPEVEKDIREAKKREEELRKQRCSLYGETRQSTKEEVKSTSKLTDPRQKTTGKLERVWPPPSKKDLIKSEQMSVSQQEAKVQRGAGHRASLWQRWESGLINGQTAPKDKNN